MSHDHTHQAIEDLISTRDLANMFGATTDGAVHESRDILGDPYVGLLTEMTRIVEHQWRALSRRGAVKGFFLSGPPGVGKTTLAKRLAYELGSRASKGSDESPVVMMLVDGSHIARARYGESEARIREIFTRAQSGFGVPGQRTVLLFDDVESILMTRGSQQAKEWHFSQDNVFFHVIDDLDTSQVVVILTTNRPDLVDEAIRDRFLEYHIGYPPLEILIEVAMQCAVKQRLDEMQLERLEERVGKAARSGMLRSMRDAERFVLQHYVEGIIGTPSYAVTRGSIP